MTKEEAIKLVQKDGSLLEQFSLELQGDKEVVLEAVSNNGFSLQFASDELRNDKEVVFAAVSNNGLSLQFAYDDSNINEDWIFFDLDDLSIKNENKLVSNQLKNDIKIVLASVSNNGLSLQFTSEIIRKCFLYIFYLFVMYLFLQFIKLFVRIFVCFRNVPNVLHLIFYRNCVIFSFEDIIYNIIRYLLEIYKANEHRR
jgi:hypothetical protein